MYRRGKLVFLFLQNEVLTFILNLSCDMLEKTCFAKPGSFTFTITIEHEKVWQAKQWAVMLIIHPGDTHTHTVHYLCTFQHVQAAVCKA